MATLLGGLRLVHLRPMAFLARVRPLLSRGEPAATGLQVLVEEALRRETEHDRYAARHLIHRTLDTKAHLRRLAPSHPRAARRYRELLALERRELERLVEIMQTSLADPEGEDALTEAEAELLQLRTEVAWCDRLLRGQAAPSN
jgi:HEAT repeat protein